MTGSNTILMVEDYADIATVYTYMLESNGFKVELATDGEQALQKVKDVKPDVVLLDIMIPKIDEVAVLQAIRTKPEYSDIQPRILIMSNLLQQDIADKAKRYGADGYVVKANMRNMDLVDIVKELLTRPRRGPTTGTGTPEDFSDTVHTQAPAAAAEPVAQPAAEAAPATESDAVVPAPEPAPEQAPQPEPAASSQDTTNA